MDIVQKLSVPFPLQFRSNSPKDSCNPDLLFVQLLSQLCGNSVACGLLSARYKLLICFLYITGCRISEALNLRYKDIALDGTVVLRGSKASYNRILYFPYLLHFFTSSNPAPDDRFFPYSYHCFYRLCLRLNLYRKIHPRSQNNSVTHLFRHNRLAILKNIPGLQFREIKNFSGHKSSKGLGYYIPSPEAE